MKRRTGSELEAELGRMLAVVTAIPELKVCGGDRGEGAVWGYHITHRISIRNNQRISVVVAVLSVADEWLD